MTVGAPAPQPDGPANVQGSVQGSTLMTGGDRTLNMRSVDDRLRLTVELELDEDRSVRGLARDAHGQALPFTGWLGLVGAVEQLRGRLSEAGLPTSDTEEAT